MKVPQPIKQISPTTIKKSRGAYLPHWYRDGAWYAVTFRLWDSLPHEILKYWLLERTNIVKTAQQMKRPLSKHEEARLEYLHSEKIEKYLDAGFGACYMRNGAIADVVANAILHFEGLRYDLSAWCVMPNHAHVVVHPFSDIIEPSPGQPSAERFTLSEILHSWKSFTAKEANKILRRSGDFWQTESYDHLIRDGSDFTHQNQYVLHNPTKAGLKDWRWVGTGNQTRGTRAIN